MEATKEIGFSEKIETAAAIAEKGRAVIVTNAQEHAAAGVIVETIRALEKELEAEYKAHPIIAQAKRMQTAKSELATLLENGRKIAKGRQMAWEDAEEKKRQAEEQRLAAEAKRQADEEAMAAAQVAQEAGNKDEAIAVLEAAIVAPAPVVVVPKTAPKAAGRRMVPKFRITNPALIPRQYLMPNEVAIGGVIRSLRGAANIPGVEFYEEAA